MGENSQKKSLDIDEVKQKIQDIGNVDTESQEETQTNVADITIAELFRAAQISKAGALTMILNVDDNNEPNKAIIVLDGAKETKQLLGLIEEEIAKWDHSAIAEQDGGTKL